MRASLLFGLVIACGPGRPNGEDVGSRCADVGTSARACWDGQCVLRSRPRSGRRCTGAGPSRRCAPRELFASPFTCEAQTCAARHLALPDAGQWECKDESGALICIELAPAAGVAPAELVPGWRCGARRSGGRVCIDTAPDRPEQGRFRCHVAHEHGERLRCDRDQHSVLLGEPCSTGCPDGSTCTEGVCLPRTDTIECWDASDCDGSDCVLGACVR